ncbi:universal stress protein [Anaeroselena agilis]|uniref:Universal stress protein n=1 Tax=Anaeroselena agilis TaxID=3063788 RepID=A0ABU3NUT6_9FIRM|nr:universal stress protein [Selenomonadales bacterium 4137-cl]
MKRNILLPFDGSTNAIAALQQAIILAKALDEEVILLNVQPTFHTAHTKLFFNENEIHEYQLQLCQETADPAIQILKDSGASFEVRLRVGVPKDIIVQEASREGEDGVRLIVMGSRGLNPIIGAFLGTTSYGVLQEAPCPVLIVPYRETEEPEAGPQLP